MNLRKLRQYQFLLRTIVAGFAGAGIFLLAGLPLPWLLGPMFVGLAFSLIGWRTAMPKPATIAVRTILGVAIGASFQPELLSRLGEMASSLALLPIYILTIGCIGYPYFRRICGFDKPTAYFSAMPGGLQDMLAFGEEAGAKVRALSLVHATRVLVIVSTLPFILEFLYGTDTSKSLAGPPAEAIPPIELLLMAIIALAGWRLASLIGLFGASITGPMILGAAASLAGIIHFRPPSEAIIVAQLVIGMGVGASYFGLTLAELRNLVLAAVGYCLILLGLAAGFEHLVVSIGAASPMEALLAYAPGGQAEMTILAIVAGADVAFVALHHVIRVFLVILGAPLLKRFI